MANLVDYLEGDMFNRFCALIPSERELGPDVWERTYGELLAKAVEAYVVMQETPEFIYQCTQCGEQYTAVEFAHLPFNNEGWKRCTSEGAEGCKDQTPLRFTANYSAFLAFSREEKER